MADEMPKPAPWGVCLSGGGIRSASYCLGVLQAMQQFDLDQPLIQGPKAKEADGAAAGNAPYTPGRADYITSVSGGSYIASALVFVAQGQLDNPAQEVISELELSQAGGVVTESVAPGTPFVAGNPAQRYAFAAGSPEERYLRDHTRYLTHGFGGPLAMVWQLLVSVVFNLLLLSLAVTVVAIPAGWVYGHLIPALQAGSSAVYHFSFSNVGWPWVPIVAGGLGLLVAFVWVIAVVPDPTINKFLLVLSLALVGLVLAWLVLAAGLPIVLEWLHRSVGTPTGSTVAAPSSSTSTLGTAAGAGAAASVLLALVGTRVARTAEAGWSDVPKGVRNALLQRGKNLLLRYRTPLINLLIFLIGPFTLLCLFLLGAHIGSLYPAWTPVGGQWDPFWAVLGTLAILVVMYTFADVTNWSLHPFYRERLSNAFCLRRFKLADAVDLADVREGKKTRDAAWLPTEVKGDFADHRPYAFEYEISEIQPDSVPTLIVCASANVSTYGATPTGFRSTSFVFSDAEIGGGLLGSHTDAEKYEGVVAKFPALKATATLPAAVAMSGAAVSPEMGRMTRAPLRFLLTVANVRLGVWIPNPLRLQWFEKKGEGGKFARSLVKPRMQHLLYEMIGKNKLTRKYLYVTDGGHYENLGLLEQLRKRSRYIFSLDASGEQQNGFSTIAGAVALAYSEAQIRIDVEPQAMAPDPTVTDDRAKQKLPPVVQSPFCVGNIYYPGDGDTPSGRLVIIKAGVPLNAPQNIADFHQSNWKFPCDSTLDQLYSADRFDAYKALGAFSASQALQYVRDDFAYFRKNGRLQPWPKGKGGFGPPAPSA